MAFYKFLSCGLVFSGSELRTRKFERERDRERVFGERNGEYCIESISSISIFYSFTLHESKLPTLEIWVWMTTITTCFFHSGAGLLLWTSDDQSKFIPLKAIQK